MRGNVNTKDMAYFKAGWLDGFKIAWLDGFETGWIDTNVVVADQLIFRSANLFAGCSNSSLQNRQVGRVRNHGWSYTNAVAAGQLIHQS